MEKFASIISSIPLQDFQRYIVSLNLSPNDYTFLVSIFSLIVALVAFGRAGTSHLNNGFSNNDALQARLDKVELSLADMRNRYANALSHLEMELKSAQHDVAETRKIIEIVFSNKNSTAETAHDYQEYHSTPIQDQESFHARGAPLDVRFSKGQERQERKNTYS